MKLLKRVYKRKLLEIEEKYGVEIVWKDNATHVQLHPGTIPSNPRSYQKGCDAFIDLYQNFFPNMCREEVELKHADDGALEAINSVEAENDVVIEKVGNKLVVYAERNKITSSVQALKENLGLPQSSRKTRRSQKSTNFGAQEHNETTREHRFSALAATVLKQLLSNRVNFSLHQGDITDERADAIVNAANEWLSHGGGVAAAIVRKGGHQIEEESRGIMLKRNRRPLDVGDAVNTSGGNLPCRFVIHTVGPRWSEWDSRESILLLRRACMESLRLAAELELCSIALPAISSGIFGMPKDICAQVMFEAIEEFSSSTDTKISTLRDVRIVIIDDETISFFREEFVRRYTSQEASPPNLQHEERPPNKEREVALKTTPELPPYSSADDPFAKQAKKSGEAGDVKTPNDGVGSEEKSRDKPKELLDGIKEVHPSNNDIPNTKEASPITAIKPPDVESEDSGTNKETGLEGSASVQRTKLSNVNTAPKPPSSMGRGALAAKETSPPNSPHEERPPNKDGEVALKATPEVPPFSSADDPFAIQPKKSREAGDVKTPHYGVGSEEKSSDEPKEVLDGIKEMHPSDDGIPYTKKVSPITGIKLPDVESEDSRTDKGAGLGGFASVKRSELSNINTAAKPPSGRGRGVLAAKFPGKQLREPGPKSSGGAQLREKGGPMNVDAGRGRGMTCATTSNAPPGLVLTDEGKRLARDHREQLRNNLNTEPDGSMKVNLEAGENGSNKEYLKEENQESKHSNRKTDGDKLDSEYPQGHSEDHDTSNLSQLDKDDASGSKLPPSDKTTDSQETEKTTTSEADRRGKLLTSMDKPRQAKSEAVIRIQVDQPSSDPTNDKTTYPEPSLPSNQSGTSPETKVVISTASHASVSGNEKDTLEGKRTSELPTALTSADGGKNTISFCTAL